jgi:hypothetical protein
MKDGILPLRPGPGLIRRLTVRHHHADPAAKMTLVEPERFGAPAREIDVRVHLHGVNVSVRGPFSQGRSSSPKCSNLNHVKDSQVSECTTIAAED